MDSVVCRVCSVEAMSHICFINYFFDYSVCYIRVTDCSIWVLGLIFNRGYSPLVPPRLLCLWFWNKTQYSKIFAGKPKHTTLKKLNAHPTYTYLSPEKKMLCCQQCSTHYAAVRINNCLKWTFAIKVATMKIMDDFRYEWKPLCAYHKNQHFSWRAKMNGTQRRTLVSPWRMHCIYSSMTKGTSWGEV